MGPRHGGEYADNQSDDADAGTGGSAAGASARRGDRPEKQGEAEHDESEVDGGGHDRLPRLLWQNRSRKAMTLTDSQTATRPAAMQAATVIAASRNRAAAIAGSFPGGATPPSRSV